MTDHDTRDGINVAITNNLARIVGLVANQHPECSVEIRWVEGSAEQLWLITASNGVDDTIYAADDEAGTWMPVSAAEADGIASGQIAGIGL